MGEHHSHHYRSSWAFEPPAVSPPLSSNNIDRDEHWRQFGNSVNAVSFGFVATAILISMFLVMAIFERFLRSTSQTVSAPSARRRQGDIESQMGFNTKLGYPSPKMTIYSKGVSVLMPGEVIPTFIAHPAPVACPPDRIQWHPHRHGSVVNPSQPRNANANPDEDPS